MSASCETWGRDFVCTLHSAHILLWRGGILITLWIGVQTFSILPEQGICHNKTTCCQQCEEKNIHFYVMHLKYFKRDIIMKVKLFKDMVRRDG